MSSQRKIYWPNRIPDELKELLANTDTPITQQEVEEQSCVFRLGGSSPNIFLKPVDWGVVNEAPVAFLNESLLEWDIPKLIIKRFLAGEGGLGPEESYQGVLLKNNSIKVMDSNSLGYFSDVLTAMSSELKINPVRVRSFCITLLSYFDYLRKSELVSFPIDVDYGLSQDCFFIQAHCENSGVFLENILEAGQEKDPENPFVSLVGDAYESTDLMEVYTLNSTGKIVFSACWVGNPHFIRKDYHSGLIIHQIDSFKAPQQKFGKTPDTQTFHKENIDNISKVKVVEKLPERYTKKEGKSLNELVNLVLVKRITNYVFDKNENHEVDWSSLSSKEVEEEYIDFPDKEALSRLNNTERAEIQRVLCEGQGSLEEDVASLKEQINPDEYLTGILNSLNNMSFEEAIVAADLDEDDSSEVVAGSVEGLDEDLQRVSGYLEDEEGLETVSGEKEDLAEEAQLVKGAAEKQDNFKQIVKGNEDSKDKPVSLVIKGDKEDLKKDSWQVKRLNVVNKVQSKIADLKKGNANHEQIDVEIKSIISSELNLDEEKSNAFVQALSDDVSDDFIHEGIDTVNENIKNRIRLEKIDNQLKIRDKQVEKMRALIAGLKNELAAVKEDSPNKEETVHREVSESTVHADTISSFNEVTTVDLDKIREKSEEITALKEELAQLKETTELDDKKAEVLELKAKSLEVERENEKFVNQISKLEKDNALLLKKFREGIEEVSEIRDSDEDTGALKEKNENLEAQVIALKKKISFLYENSKANKEIEISATEVQKLVEDKERFFNEKMKAQEEINHLKAEARESERVLKQKDLEISQKSDLLQNKPVGEEEDIVKNKDVEIAGLKQQVRVSNEELKATQLKTKSFEQKVKFLNAQLEKYQSQRAPSVNSSSVSIDPRVAAKLKQSEVMNARLKDAADKFKKELGEKKTELHKAKLEAKTMNLKIKDLEKKLLQLAKKKAA